MRDLRVCQKVGAFTVTTVDTNEYLYAFPPAGAYIIFSR